jgi:hypothetical protein
LGCGQGQQPYARFRDGRILWKGFGSQGSEAGKLEAPTATDVAWNGDLLVGDQAGRVQEFTPSGEYVRQFGQGQLDEPESIVSVGGDIPDKLYVSDGGANRIEQWYYPGLPTVTSNEASAVTSRGATLNATVNPSGIATTYRFEYGWTTNYGVSVPVPDASAGSGRSDVSVNQMLTDLVPQKTYHYRIVATNAEGVVYGSDKSFTTLAALPGRNDRICNGCVYRRSHPAGDRQSRRCQYGVPV